MRQRGQNGSQSAGARGVGADRGVGGPCLSCRGVSFTFAIRLMGFGQQSCSPGPRPSSTGCAWRSAHADSSSPQLPPHLFASKVLRGRG